MAAVQTPAERPAPTPLPFKHVFCICTIQVCEAWSICVLFPFVVFMVRDFGIAAREEDVGYFVGLLTAAFCAAQALTSGLWGWASDVYGRKPVLISGLIGAAGAQILFGTSATFGQAMCGRIVGGLLNGNISVLKAYMGVVTDSSNRGAGFAMMSFAWGIGSVVAPLAGGVLIDPARKFPGVDWWVFGTYPYLLPCAVGACVQLVVATISWFVFDEPSTRRLRRRSSTAGALASARLASPVAGACSGAAAWLCGRRRQYAPVASGEAAARVDSEDARSEAAADVRPPAPPVLESEARGAAVDGAGDERRQAAHGDIELVPLVGDTGGSARADADGPAASRDEAALDAEDEAHDAKFNLCDPSILWATGVYGIIAFLFIIYDEVFPLWCAAPIAHGGLDFTSAEIGIAFSWTGVFLIFFTLTILPRVSRRYGNFGLLRRGLLLGVPVFVAMPAVAYLGPSLVWLALAPMLVLRQIVGTLVFVSINLLVTNSVTANNVGSVNGLGQTCASVARAVGPALGGAMWSLSEASTVPLHQFVVFAVVGAIALSTWCLTWWMPAHLEHSREVKLRDGGGAREPEPVAVV